MQTVCSLIIHVASLQYCTDCCPITQLGWHSVVATSVSLSVEQVLTVYETVCHLPLNSVSVPTYFCRCVPLSSQPTCLEAGSSSPLIYCKNFLYAADSDSSLLQDWKCSSAVAHGTCSCSRTRYSERFRGTDAFITPALIKQNKNMTLTSTVFLCCNSALLLNAYSFQL